VAGAWTWQPPLLATGWLALVGAVGVIAANLLPLRRRAPRGRDVGAWISLGHSALGLAMAVTVGRLGAEFGWWRVDRLGLRSAHVHLAAVGFATLTAAGVGSTLLPMFLMSRERPRRRLRWIGPVAAWPSSCGWASCAAIIAVACA
jgi:hypothetical protein